MKIRFDRVRVCPALIDIENTTYRITTRSDPGDLMPSVTRLGLIRPPILRWFASGYQVVSGFRRIKAWQQAAMSRQRGGAEPGIEALLVPEAMAEAQVAMLAVVENSLQRPLDLMEQSRALNLLTASAGQGEALGAAAMAAGLPHQKVLTAKLLALIDLPPEVQVHVASGAIGLAVALEMLKSPPLVARILGEIFATLKLSLNKQKEVLTLVAEIALREGLDPIDVICSPAISEVIDAEGLDRGQKSHQLRQYLRARRYPALCKAETQFEKQLGQIDPGDGLRIIPPPYFEDTNFKILLSFENPANLRARLDQVAALIANPRFQGLLQARGNENGLD